MVPVRIELWFGSYFGATTNDFSTFRNAIIVARIVARISPTGSAVLPSSSSLSTTIHPLSTSLSTYPSVLLPAPGSSSSSETFAVPRRSRTPSIGGGAASGSSPSIRPPPSLASFGSGSSSRLPPLPSLTSNPSATLPPFGTLGALPPLGVLPPLGTFPSPGISHNTTPRKRRTSTIATPLLDRYDHGSGFSGSGSHLTSRPRLRSPTPQSGHRRSISSEAGHSNYSTTSSSSSFENSFGDRHGGPSVPLEAFPPIQRPPSRNRRSSQFDMMNTFENGSGAVPHIPILLPESPSKSSSFFLSNHHLDYMNHSPYKPKKQSYIAIDDSFNPPSPPPPPPQRSSDPSSSLALNSQLHHSTSLDCDRSHLPQNYEWLPLAGLPSSFASLSLDSPESQHSPTDSQY